jgi:2-polyprenyl-3-methyl-5-hydroxy-6-metoxy-1,4-benzoquinol methylase
MHAKSVSGVPHVGAGRLIMAPASPPDRYMASRLRSLIAVTDNDSRPTPMQFHSASGSSAAPYLLDPVFALAGAVGTGDRVLDVGCGNGFWASEFARRGCTVVGIDPSPTGIAIARDNAPKARFEVMDVSDHLLADLGEEPFDLVVSIEVIEHVYSPHTLAIGCWRALRPGGTLVLSTPYHGRLKDVALAVSGKLDRHHDALREGGHIKFFSRPVLERLLTESGFEGVRFAGAGRLPTMWKSMVLAAVRPLCDHHALHS